MNLMPRWNWLHEAMRPAPKKEALDAADMGTAFGLDACIHHVPDTPRSTQPKESDAPRLSRYTGLPRRD